MERQHAIVATVGKLCTHKRDSCTYSFTAQTLNNLSFDKLLVNITAWSQTARFEHNNSLGGTDDNHEVESHTVSSFMNNCKGN